MTQDDTREHPAPEWRVERWFNVETPLTLEGLRGKVVALHAFQMLCPGCVAHGIPQAQRLQEVFAGRDLVVVGLHTVFEHHDAMRPHALEAFLHEYRVSFPVGVDAHRDGGPQPLTMCAYAMRGTPTLILIDRGGRMRYHMFGRPDDMSVGARVAELLSESVGTGAGGDIGERTETGRRSDQGCPVGA